MCNLCNSSPLSIIFVFPSLYSVVSPVLPIFMTLFFGLFQHSLLFCFFFLSNFFILCPSLLLTWMHPFHIIHSLSFLSDSLLHHQGSSPLMSSRHVHSSSNAKKREVSSNVTCSRGGVLQTVKSIKWHFPQCFGSPNLHTSVTNDTLVSSLDQEDLTVIRWSMICPSQKSITILSVATCGLYRNPYSLILTMMMMILTTHLWICLP
jgi:hypothetical protein